MNEYTDEEKDLLRKQLREGNRVAREAAKRAGAKLHPRIAAMRCAECDCENPPHGCNWIRTR